MLASSKLLRSYVRAIHRLSGAEAVSLYVPGSATGLSKPILIHEGDGAPAPELRTEAAAEAFDRSHTRSKNGEAEAPPTSIESGAKGCRIIRVPAIHSVVATTNRELSLSGRRRCWV